MTHPDLTYIVSAFNRPELLPICLHSLATQTHHNAEIIVADNAPAASFAANRHKEIVEALSDPRMRYINTASKKAGTDCYEASEWVIKNAAKGMWLAFPCDDCYYVPDFGQRMLTEAYSRNLDMVYCNELIGPDAAGGGAYHVWDVQPKRIPKTAFIIRASAFPGWCERPKSAVPVGCDFVLGQQMQGPRQGKLNECLLAHN